MKKMFLYIYRHPVKILFILLTIIFLPIMSILNPQSQEIAIVRTLGIDKTDDGFEVTIVSYEPASTQSFKENYILISAKGETVSSALNLAGDYVGKKIGLAHLNNIIVSDDIAQGDLAQYLDYLIRSYSLNNATNVINTNISAKEFLSLNLDIQANNSNQESNFIEHNIRSVNGGDTDLEDVIVSAYSPSKTALIHIINIDKEDGLDLSGKSSTSGESSNGLSNSLGGSEEKEEPKFLNNSGMVGVIVNGKKVGELNREEMQALTWLNKQFKDNKIILNNYSDRNLEDAKVSLISTSKRLKFDCYFEDGAPVIIANLNIKVEVTEVMQNNHTVKMFTPNNEFVNDRMTYFVSEKIKEDIYPVWDKVKSLNADPFDFYQLLNKKYRKEFNNYLNSLDDKNNYIDGIKLLIKVDCTGC